ncbi:MAG TPA: transporter substrate-binding domain-containing protein [Gaiellaceae bacterium]|jgi:polar amino acid transport system substrate-binding protein
MRRFTLLCSAFALAVATAAVVATAGSAKVTSFKFCSDPTFPPLESKTTSGKAVGFDIDMANAIATSWGGKATFVQTAFTGLLPALSAHKCDVVISGLFVTPDRTKQFPAVAYMRTHRALVVQGGNPKHIASPNDLEGKHVAVQAGTKYEEYLKGLKAKLGFTLQSYPGDTDAVAQLLIGRADAVLTQDTSGAYQIKQHPGKVAIAYLFPASDAFGIYYRKSDAALGAQLKAGIATLKKNGTLGKLAVKYSIPSTDVR